MFGNVRQACRKILKNLRKSSEIFRKWSEIIGKSSEVSLLVCLHNKQNITCPPMDMNFIFSCSTLYLTHSLCSLVRYRVEQSKITFISMHGHVISSISVIWSNFVDQISLPLTIHVWTTDLNCYNCDSSYFLSQKECMQGSWPMVRLPLIPWICIFPGFHIGNWWVPTVLPDDTYLHCTCTLYPIQHDSYLSKLTIFICSHFLNRTFWSISSRRES